jgi:hypothetical protein
MDTFSSTLKSVGAFVLTAALFAGLGYYVYTALFIPPTPAKDEIVAAHSAAPMQPEKVTVTGERKPS